MTRGFGISALLALGTVSSLPAAPPPPTAKEPSNPFLAWSVKDEVGQNAFNHAALIHGKVIGGTDRGELIAIDAKTGKPVWKVAHGHRIYHAPAGDTFRVYFTSDQGVTAVKADSGILTWSYNFNVCDGPVLVKPELFLVYVGGTDGNLHALDSRDGNLKWKKEYLSDAPKDPTGYVGNTARITGTSARPNSLAADVDTIYLNVMDQCRVVAFDAKTGDRKATYQTAGWTWGPAAVTKTHVFVGSQDGHFYAFDKSTGKELWKVKTKGRADAGGVVDEDAVIFGSSDGTLYCVNLTDGREKWKFTPPVPAGRRKGVHSVPVVNKATVVIASADGVFYGLSKHVGTELWKFRPVEYSDVFHPVLGDGTQYFTVVRPSGDGRTGYKGQSAVVAVGVK